MLETKEVGKIHIVAMKLSMQKRVEDRNMCCIGGWIGEVFYGKI